MNVRLMASPDCDFAVTRRKLPVETPTPEAGRERKPVAAGAMSAKAD